MLLRKTILSLTASIIIGFSGFSNNNPTTAFEVQHNGTCNYGTSEFSNIGATGEGPSGSCGNQSSFKNRWYKFTATGENIEVALLTGNSGFYGTIRKAIVTLFDANFNELACSKSNPASPRAPFDHVKLTYQSLEEGAEYYVSVDTDNQYSSYNGRYRLCVKNVISNDFVEGAIEVGGEQVCNKGGDSYTTVDATADVVSESCGTPNYNKWFKFTALAGEAAIVNLKTGSSGYYGNMRRPVLGLYNNDMELIECIESNPANQGYPFDNLKIMSTELSEGATYYVMVDNDPSHKAYSGSFTLCVNVIGDNDWYANALPLDHTGECYSGGKCLNTDYATKDRRSACMWAPSTNRWFQFKAETSEVEVSLLSSGSRESIKFGIVSLFGNNMQELACGSYTSKSLDPKHDDVKLIYTNLIVGNTYHISVDNSGWHSSYTGEFTICLKPQISNDFPEGALEVAADGTCNSGDGFTTMDGTRDNTVGECIEGKSNFNKWFKFEANNEAVSIDLLTGGEEGNIKFAWITVFDSNLDFVSCAAYDNNSPDSPMDDINLIVNGLSIGSEYYISVDNSGWTKGYQGDFTLCVNPVIQAGKFAMNETEFASKVNLFPNPTTNNVTLTGLVEGQLSTIEIYSLTGELLRSEATTQNTLSLNLVELNSGLYVLRIKSGQATKAIQLVLN